MFGRAAFLLDRRSRFGIIGSHAILLALQLFFLFLRLLLALAFDTLEAVIGLERHQRSLLSPVASQRARHRSRKPIVEKPQESAYSDSSRTALTTASGASRGR